MVIAGATVFGTGVQLSARAFCSFGNPDSYVFLDALGRYLGKSRTELSGRLFNAVISHEASAVSRLNFGAPVLRKFPCCNRALSIFWRLRTARIS